MVTHDRSMLTHFDRVLTLSAGQLSSESVGGASMAGRSGLRLGC